MSMKRNEGKLYPVYEGMFLDDFCNVHDYSYSCNKELEEMLPDDISSYLEDVFENITRQLTANGRAYVEILAVKDDNGDMKEMSFNCFHPLIVFKGIHKLFFISKTHQGKYSLCSADKKMIAVFDLKELGYSRFEFKRILKRADKLEELRHSDMFMDKNLDINITETISKLDLKLLKCTRDIYWDVRMGNSCYFNDFYSLWRKVKFKELKLRFLDYMLSKINDMLKLNGLGEIVTETGDFDYSEEFVKLQRGEMSRMELAYKLYRR